MKVINFFMFLIFFRIFPRFSKKKKLPAYSQPTQLDAYFHDSKHLYIEVLLLKILCNMQSWIGFSYRDNLQSYPQKWPIFENMSMNVTSLCDLLITMSLGFFVH